MGGDSPYTVYTLKLSTSPKKDMCRLVPCLMKSNSRLISFQVKDIKLDLRNFTPHSRAVYTLTRYHWIYSPQTNQNQIESKSWRGSAPRASDGGRAAALAVRCSRPSQKRDSNLQKKTPHSTSFSITPSSAQKDMSDKQMKHVKWLSSSLVHLWPKSMRLLMSHFGHLVAAKPAKPSRFQLLSFGVW